MAGNHWLDEYREAVAAHRHYETLRWTVIGLTYPSAFAAIAFAGNRWGFGTGRAFLIYAVSTVWMVAGSLVFAQMHFYDRVTVWRARWLESMMEPEFRILSHSAFPEPPEPTRQPAHTRGLAVWFTAVTPVVALLACTVLGVLMLTGATASLDSAARDQIALWAGLALLVAATAGFLVTAWIRERPRKPRKAA